MAEERKPLRGDEIENVKSIKSLKTPMINLFRTYPVYQQWYGIIETYFKGELGEEVVDILDEDGLIKIEPDTHPRVYRLTPKGIDFAISMINLEHSERVQKYAKETHTFNIWIRRLTISLFVIGITQILLVYFQNPIF